MVEVEAGRRRRDRLPRSAFRTSDRSRSRRSVCTAFRRPRTCGEACSRRSPTLGVAALAPDLPGFGDSPPDPPGTWERQVEAVERLRRRARASSGSRSCVHDWGGLIGLRWACEHPERRRRARHIQHRLLRGREVARDGPCHAHRRARARNGPRSNEGGICAHARRRLTGIDATVADEYWKTFETQDGRQGILDLYRSGDFEKLKPYDGQLSPAGRPDADPLGRERPVRAGRPAPIVSSRRSQTRSSWCSKGPATSSTRTSPSAAPARWPGSSRQNGSDPAVRSSRSSRGLCV